MNRKFFYGSVLLLVFIGQAAMAQTEHDAIMMNKRQWCNGLGYTHSRWENYWEGTLKRDNLNIGKMTTQSVMAMSNYGITDKLNIMAGLPYIWTRASGGTLHTMKGFQDLSLYVKWKPYTFKWGGNSKFSLLGVAGISIPVNNYVVDFLPLSIGLGTTNVSGRLVADYQKGIFFTTASGAYIRRSNTKLDRTSYYTTHLVLSNKVEMPDAANFMLSAGLRKKYLIAEAMITQMNTLGGFDIRRNDMPFPSNDMDMTTIGAHIKYTLPFYTYIELTADGSCVVAGRNAGQATAFGMGAYYLFTFKSKRSK